METDLQIREGVESPGWIPFPGSRHIDAVITGTSVWDLDFSYQYIGGCCMCKGLDNIMK